MNSCNIVQECRKNEFLLYQAQTIITLIIIVIMTVGACQKRFALALHPNKSFISRWEVGNDPKNKKNLVTPLTRLPLRRTEELYILEHFVFLPFIIFSNACLLNFWSAGIMSVNLWRIFRLTWLWPKFCWPSVDFPPTLRSYRKSLLIFPAGTDDWKALFHPDANEYFADFPLFVFFFIFHSAANENFRIHGAARNLIRLFIYCRNKATTGTE